MSERKLAFYEVAGGRVGADVQEEFEKAHEIAADRGLPVTVTLSITVYPPEHDDPRYGAVKYAVSRTNPKKQSHKLITVLKKGLAISDGKNRDDAMTLQLELEPPKTENQIELPQVAEGGK